VLGIVDTATADEVRRAHRRLILARHPDKETGDHDRAAELNKRATSCSMPCRSRVRRETASLLA
jgi:preprotein translocase subunit Sec63